MRLIEPDPERAYMLPYAPAVEVPPGRGFVFLSGASSVPGAPWPLGAREQAEFLVAERSAALAACGLGWADVVHVYEFIVDMRDAPALHIAMDEVLGPLGWKPANTMLGVDGLAVPQARFDLDLIAVRPERP